MPDHDLAREEVLALATFVLGHRRPPPPAYRRELGERVRARRDGERLLRRLNCRGCHELAGRGGAHLRRRYADPTHAPPTLAYAGKKFRQGWLFEFLGAPSRVRPWLVARMPSFALAEPELNRLLRALVEPDGVREPFVREREPRLEPAACADAWRLFGKLQCMKCHQLSTARRLKPGELAPDLALSAARLRPRWLEEWLLVPQRLQPGTRMPTYFPLADDDDPASFITPYPELVGGDVARQVAALARLNLELGRGAGAEPRCAPASGKKGKGPPP
jgi:hypothetical protein